jgi:hypothetical protein
MAMEAAGSSSLREETIKRLGAKLIPCKACDQSFAYDADDLWYVLTPSNGEIVLRFSSGKVEMADDEDDDEGSVEFTCSEECAAALVGRINGAKVAPGDKALAISRHQSPRRQR